jgi:hypothetical protein
LPFDREADGYGVPPDDRVLKLVPREPGAPLLPGEVEG